MFERQQSMPRSMPIEKIAEAEKWFCKPHEIDKIDKANKEAETRIRKARETVLVANPFFGSLVYSMPNEICWYWKWRKGASATAYTDGRKIVFNPLFVLMLTHDELCFLLCHEVMHPALQHIGRLAGRNPRTWNHAIDYSVNLLITDYVNDCINTREFASSWKMPPCGLFDKKWRGQSPEQIYAELIKQKEHNKLKERRHNNCKTCQNKQKQKQKKKQQQKQPATDWTYIGIDKKIAKGGFVWKTDDDGKAKSIQISRTNIKDEDLTEWLIHQLPFPAQVIVNDDGSKTVIGLQIVVKCEDDEILATLNTEYDVDDDSVTLHLHETIQVTEDHAGEVASIKIKKDESDDGENNSSGDEEGEGDGERDGEGDGAPDDNECPDCGQNSSDDEGISAEDMWKDLEEGLTEVIRGDDMTQEEEQMMEKWRDRLIQAASIARSIGKIPMGIDKIIENMYKPVVDWRVMTMQYVSEITKGDYTYSRPNARLLSTPNNVGVKTLSGIITPSLYSKRLGEVVAILDDSGSMYNHIQYCVSEVIGLFHSTLGTVLRFVTCDTEANHICDWEPGGAEPDIHGTQVIGGGGTSFSPPFEMIRDKGWTPKLVLYFTDLDGAVPPIDLDPGCPVLWIVINDYHSQDDLKDSFGTFIEMTEIVNKERELAK